MFPAGCRVLAAVSGGADSMALLHLLAVNRERLGLEAVYAFHLNHGLRGAEAGRDEQAVRSFCRTLGVPLYCEHARMLAREKPAGLSVEMWARELRCRWYYRYARRLGCRVATAHNQNDCAETVLFQLARGSGLDGAAGIPPVRELAFSETELADFGMAGELFLQQTAESAFTNGPERPEREEDRSVSAVQPPDRPIAGAFARPGTEAAVVLGADAALCEGSAGTAGAETAAGRFGAQPTGESGGHEALPVMLVRPLIGTPRADVERYCAQNGIAFVTDSTNLSDLFSRNRVRHTVLPALEQVNAAAAVHLAAFAGRAGEAQDYIGSQAEALLCEAALGDGWCAGCLAASHPALQSEAVRRLLGCHADAARVSLCLAALRAGQGRVQLAPDCYFTVSRGVVSVRAAAVQSLPYCVEARPGANRVGEWTLHLLQNDEFSIKNVEKPQERSLLNAIDCGKIIGNICFRSKIDGEVFKSARFGVTKPLKKLYAELGIAPERRPGWPLLADEKGPVWVLGIGAAQRVRVDGATRSAIEIQTEHE